VYPAEIESVLHSHPAVAEAAVIGVPHEKWGEVGKAFVVLRSGQSLSEEQLQTYLAERLAKYKVPRHVEFVTSLPKTAIGKIDKKQLV
ncbi:MAG: long-chain fatty acid--CoA ligase, partial [Calditrichaeota bacterium]